MPTSGALGAVYSGIGQSSIFIFRDARAPSRNRDQRAACVLAALPNHRAIPCLSSKFAFATRVSRFSVLRNQTLVSRASKVFLIGTKHYFCLLNMCTKSQLSVFYLDIEKNTWRRYPRLNRIILIFCLLGKEARTEQ
jgi:hypothetical protein